MSVRGRLLLGRAIGIFLSGLMLHEVCWDFYDLFINSAVLGRLREPNTAGYLANIVPAAGEALRLQSWSGLAQYGVHAFMLAAGLWMVFGRAEVVLRLSRRIMR